MSLSRSAIRALSTTTVVAAFVLRAATAWGQVTTITPTAGAGNLGTAVTQNGSSFDITGGTRSGGNGRNLFHSFGLFSVGPGDIANFTNETGLPTSNIIGRVTGGVRSEIFGTIQTTNFGAANLFLLNPAGWLFGAGSSLNVGGAFHVTTAHYLGFGNNEVFCVSACPSGKTQVLSAADPAAFGFLGPTQPIEVRGAAFSMPEGQPLSIVGGDLTIAEFSFLFAPGGRVQLGSFASAGEASVIGLEGTFGALGTVRIENSTILTTGTASLDINGNVVGRDGGPVVVSGGRVELVGTTIDVSGAVATFDANGLPIGTRSGSVVIRGGELIATSSSDFLIPTTITAFNFGTDTSADVTIGLLMSGSVRLTSGASLQSGTAGGDPGDVKIAASNFEMDGAAFISSNRVGPGRGADITIDAGAVTIAGGASIGTQSGGSAGPAGAGGDIRVTVTDPTGALAISGSGSSIQSQSTSSEATGRGGAVTISAPTVSIRDSGFVSTVASSLTAPAGDITMDVHDLTITGGGLIQGITLGGPGGTIRIDATGLVTIAGAGSGVTSGGALGAFGSGTAGNIIINAGDLTVTDLGVIQNGTTLDVAGNITVAATEAITLSNGGAILSQAFSENVGDVTLTSRTLLLDNGLIQTSTRQAGNAGNVSINVADLSLMAGGKIVSSTEGSGVGGRVTVTTSTATLTGSETGIFSTAEPTSVGPAGRIALSGQTLTLADGAQLSVTTAGTGAAGDIAITMNSVAVNGGAHIDSSTISAGLGGNLTLAAGNVSILGVDSGLFSTASSTGNAGRITVDATALSLTDAAKIAVDTSGTGNAGAVALNVGTLSLAGGARVDSSTTAGGRGGDIALTAGASGSITGADSGLFSTASSTGNAGQIAVSAPSLTLTDNARISVVTSGAGNAGDIVLNVNAFSLGSGARVDSSTSGAGRGGTIALNAPSGTLTINGEAGMFSDAGGIDGSGTGAGGDINIAAHQIYLDGATISAKSTGTETAIAGNINIVFGTSLEMLNSGITTDSRLADGGNISITATGSTLHLLDSLITTSVGTGFGGGGNITIGSLAHPLDIIVLDGSQIRADAFGGPGGNINILADVFLTQGTLISASSALAAPGTIAIQAQLTDVTGALAQLPESILEAAALLRASCMARLAEGKASSLVVAGRAGVPPAPDAVLWSPLTDVDGLPARAEGRGGEWPHAYPTVALRAPCVR